ncbi:hypothetical protein [Varibaculum cambriense]|nr:hypothetical protein [Varibaculum cambriense]MDU1683963.1 hypothetical protein [Varibaculum cambriense]
MRPAVKGLEPQPLFSSETSKYRVRPKEKNTPYKTAEVPSAPPPETVGNPLTVPSSSAPASSPPPQSPEASESSSPAAPPSP